MKTICNKFLQLIMVIIVVEAILGGAGRLVVISGLSLRMLLYAAAFILLFLTLIIDKKFKDFYLSNKNIFTLLVVLFLVYLGFAAVNGYVLHNNSLGEIAGDITGYLTLVLLFIFNFTIDDSQHVGKFVNIAAAAIVIQAIIILVLHYLIGFELIDVDSFNKTLQNLYIGAFTNLPAGAVRIFFKSSIYLQIGFILLVYMFESEEYKQYRKLIAASLVVVTYAAFLTYTRAFWLGAAVSFIFLIFTRSIRKLGKIIAVSIAGFLIMTAISYAIYGDLRTIGSAIGRFGYLPQFSAKERKDTGEKKKPLEKIEDISANYRAELKYYMGENIKESPVIGNGLGVIIKKLQTASRSEYMYLDIIMEMGIVGLILYLSIFIVMFIKWLKIRSSNLDKDSIYRLNAMMAALAGIMATTALNPFLNNPIGLTYVVLVIAVINLYSRRNSTVNYID